MSSSFFKPTSPLFTTQSSAPGQQQQQPGFNFGSSFLSSPPSFISTTSPAVPGFGVGGGTPGGSAFGGGGGFQSQFSPGFSSSSVGPSSSRPPMLGISGGSPPFIPTQPAQTPIIGGVSKTVSFPTSFLKKNSPDTATGLATSTFGGTGSAGGSSGMFGLSRSFSTEGQQCEPMSYSPIGSGGSGMGISSSSLTGLGDTSSTTFHQPQNQLLLPCYFLGLDQPYQPFPSGSSPSAGASSSFGPSSFISPSKGYKRTVLFEPQTILETEKAEIVGMERGEGSSSGSGGVKKKGPPIHGFGFNGRPSATEFLSAVMQSDVPTTDSRAGIGVGSGELFVRSPLLPPPTAASPRSPSSAYPSSISPSKCWVTVFGFPAGASSFIIDNFSALGNIVEIKSTPGSNWLHLKFSNPIEARRAVSKNGKVFGQSIMVGVRTSDLKVVEEAENGEPFNTSSKCKTVDSGERVQRPAAERNQSVGCENTTPIGKTEVIKSRLRPLAASTSQAMAFGNQGYCRNGRDIQLPTASTGIITKAMEYMFGW